MVQFAIERLRADPRFDVAHLEWRFTETFERFQSASLRKVGEVGRTLLRLAGLRRWRRFDVALFPVGSPSFSSTVRDLVLLPFVLLSTRRTVLHFHGAGHQAAWAPAPPWWARLTQVVYRRADSALVMTPFNEVDPRWMGIQHVDVLPHRLPDAFDPALVREPRTRPWTLLYVGHLGPQRSTPALVEAFARFHATAPDARLHLVGRCSYGYTSEELRASIRHLGVGDAVDLTEELTGRDKWLVFGAASCFAFPSVYECESFGLVLAEAMMWGLPVVLTDWRGNTEVVPADCDRHVVRVDGDVVSCLEAAIAAAYNARTESGFSDRNRAAYLARYASFDDWPIGDVLVR